MTALGLVVLLGIVSCGSDHHDSTPAPVTQTHVFRGVWVEARDTSLLGPPRSNQGTITLAVTGTLVRRRAVRLAAPEAQAIDSVDVQMRAQDGTTSHFSGRFDPSTGAFTASTSGLALTGVLANGRFGGVMSTGSVVIGSFTAILPTTSTYHAHCGVWDGAGASTADAGDIPFIVDATVVAGVAHNEDGTQNFVDGSYASNGDIVMTFPQYTFAGTTTAYGIAGTYASTLDGGRSGTWTSSACGF